MSGFALRSSFGIFASHRTAGLDPAAYLFSLRIIPVRPLRHCSRGLTRHGPRVVDIELDNLAGKGCCGHQRHALRRLKAVPSTLRINRDHPGAESEGLGPILAEDFQARNTLDDMDQLVTSEVGLPMAFPRKLRDAKDAVAVRCQSRSAALSLRHRRLRGPPPEH